MSAVRKSDESERKSDESDDAPKSVGDPMLQAVPWNGMTHLVAALATSGITAHTNQARAVGARVTGTGAKYCDPTRVVASARESVRCTNTVR